MFCILNLSSKKIIIFFLSIAYCFGHTSLGNIFFVDIWEEKYVKIRIQTHANQCWSPPHWIQSTVEDLLGSRGMRLCATILITPVSQAQNYIRCIIVSSIISISSLTDWHYTGQVKPQLLKYVTSIKLLYSRCYHWSGSLSSAGVAAVGVDHADEARRLAPRPLAHHHHVHAAQEEAVIETVRPETL